MGSQNARLKIKHPVLLNVAIKTMFTPLFRSLYK